MISLGLPDGPLSVVCIGAHPDDIEIGCGGTLLSLSARPDTSVAILVLTGTPQRAAEARAAAACFVPRAQVQIADFADGRLPESWGAVKEVVHSFRDAHPQVDVVFAPRAADLHQDHALLGTMAPTVWRDSIVLSYEIPKWDGDPAAPNVYVPLTREQAERKIALLNQCFPSQHPHDWWDDEVFRGVMRLRGMESRSTYAEAFEVRKALLSL